ncbi:MAG TPA: FtsX-like permease family protein [Ktedonobacterales bacterium]
MRSLPDLAPDDNLAPAGEHDHPDRRDTTIWRAVWPGPLAAARVAALRLRHAWRPLLAVNLGVLIASVLICALPLYTGVIADIQLQRLLATAPVTQVNLDIGVTTSSIQSSAADQISANVRDTAFGEIDDFASAYSSRYASLTRLSFATVNGSYKNVIGLGVDTSAALAYTFDPHTGAPHMKLYSGRLPRDVAPGQPLEVLVTPKMGAKPGDIITLNGPPGNQGTLTVKVAGVWFPTNPADVYWDGFSWDTHESVLLAGRGAPPEPPIFPLVFTHDGFFQALADIATGSGGSLSGPASNNAPVFGMRLDYIYQVNRTALTVQNMASVVGQLQRLRSNLTTYLPGSNGIRSVVVATDLDTLIESLLAQMQLLALPLTMVIVELAGVALLFTTTMAGLLIDDAEAEIATLATRGASGTQMIGVFAVQSALLALITAAVSPFIAFWAVFAFVRRIVPEVSVTPDYLSTAVSLQTMVTAVAIAAGVGIAAVVLGATRAARLDIAAFRREQARGVRRPLWQRLYLDVGLALLCVAGYVDLFQFGGLGVRQTLQQAGQSAGKNPDPVLALVPVASLVAGALVLLRVFPPVAQTSAKLAKGSRGAPGLLAFAQLARGGGQHARLALLLTVCVGLGIFTLGFGASLDQNAHDRAAYSVGADLQVQLQDDVQKTPFAHDVGKQFARLPGVLAVTPIYRSQARSSSDSGARLLNLLGVDPATFASVGYWRNDFSAQPLASLMHQMHQREGNPRAGTPEAPLWALIDTRMASDLALRPGDRFTISPQEGGSYDVNCVVGAVVNDFPTMYDTNEGGFVVTDETDLLTAYDNPELGNLLLHGPTEYWFHTTGTARDNAALAQAFNDPNLYVGATVALRDITNEIAAGPTQAGLNALLLAGALIAALLGIFGSLVQAGIAARRRHAQFAVLHAIGGTGSQLTRIVVWQQAAVYLFALVGGTLLGYVLTLLILPTLQFAGGATGPDAAVPPYILVYNPLTTAGFYAVLVVAFAAGLAIAAARARGLGAQALRLSED